MPTHISFTGPTVNRRMFCDIPVGEMFTYKDRLFVKSSTTRNHTNSCIEIGGSIPGQYVHFDASDLLEVVNVKIQVTRNGD